ncbi:(2Fe-2S)-binding protein [Aminobacter aminovorans]|uniref:Molibdopterin-dependent oxidoreductase YjgC n=1 Tax=Aminobacter aminovorans TaxID=83263 RepID=A0AAC8YVN5_AMIAI|nr:(2Fe-2S)-binding protein [Aminobacter aminovorans]AMS45322.1 SoxA protein [Aminobacter aminovorans]MBB3708925.1 putative molibdopterin-dependent oxidoreductase YjgC [Aminobacter aminovorans]
MFERLERDGAEVSFTFAGQPCSGQEGDSVAAALFGAGVRVFRNTPVSGAERSAFCMIGACFDCLVVIDGVGSRQACLTSLREGMVIERQTGRREPSK